ncbi:MAG TPA: hypothetical protein VFW96_19420 [Thermomicrobiales bacterium]|nr:hypothetical protein [Thermomicrobiales bacterium]
MATDDADAGARQETPVRNPALQRLDALAGAWAVEVAHPRVPTPITGGRVTFEWLEDSFLLQRTAPGNPDFPSSVAVIGGDDTTGRYTMQYFDSRGVARIYEMSLDPDTWRLWRQAPGFSQRFTGTFADDGDTIVGSWELSRDGATWEHDFGLIYRKAS